MCKSFKVDQHLFFGSIEGDQAVIFETFIIYKIPDNWFWKKVACKGSGAGDLKDLPLILKTFMQKLFPDPVQFKLTSPP